MIEVNDKIKQAIINGETGGYQQPYVQIDLTPNSSNKEYIDIYPADIKQGGLSIDKSCLSGETLELGSAVASEMTLTVVNCDGKFDGKDFNGAWATVYINFAIDGTQVIKLGVYTIDEFSKSGNEITLKGLDRMMWLDKVIDTDISYYNNLATLVDIWAYQCNLTASEHLINNINNLPNATSWDLSFSAKDTVQWSDGYTYRQLFNQVGTMMGVVWCIDANGELDYRTYPKYYSSTQHTAAPKVTITPSMRYSSDIDPQQITVTDMKYTWGDKDHTLVGDSSGVVIDLGEHTLSPQNSKLSTVQTRFKNLKKGSKILPFTYYSTSMSCVPMFWLEPMDWAYYEDNEGNKYPTLITSCTYTLNGTMELESGGENPQKNGYSKKSSSTYKSDSKAELRAYQNIYALLSTNGLYTGRVGEDQLIWTDNQTVTPNATSEVVSLSDEVESTENNSEYAIAAVAETDEESDEPTADDNSYNQPATGSTVWRLGEDGTIMSTDSWRGSVDNTSWKGGVENANDLYIKNLFAKNILANGEIRYESDGGETVTVLDSNGISAKTLGGTNIVRVNGGEITCSIDGGKHNTYIMGANIECESLHTNTLYGVASYIGIDVADSATTSVANNTWVKVATISLSPGFYTGAVYGGFAVNTGDYIGLAFTSSSTVSTSDDRVSYTVPNGKVQDRVVLPISFQVEGDRAVKYYIYARQTSGKALDVTPSYGFLKINGG